MSTPDADYEWAVKQTETMDEGIDIVRRAGVEALDYMGDSVEHLNDKAWKRMSMETQAVEMGIGVALVEHLVPQTYARMEKKLHKELKVKKHTAEALRHIFIGRVVKNIMKELEQRNERNQ